MRLDHVERRQPFGMAGDPRQTGIDQQPVAVLHQGVADEAELGLHARTLSVEHGIGIAGRGVGVVAPFLAAEVDLLHCVHHPLEVRPSPPSLGLRLFMLAQASTSVPSTEK